MLNAKFTRTTISVPDDLLFEIKKKALMEKKSMKEVVLDGLRLIIRYKFEVPKTNSLLSLYGVWGKGKKGSEFVKKIRNSAADGARDNYLQKSWKKS